MTFHLSLNCLKSLQINISTVRLRLVGKMCLTHQQIEQTCGFLLLNEFSVFIYCCKVCTSEFKYGTDLEAHILWEHQVDEKEVESVLVAAEEPELEPISDEVPIKTEAADESQCEKERECIEEHQKATTQDEPLECSKAVVNEPIAGADTGPDHFRSFSDSSNDNLVEMKIETPAAKPIKSARKKNALQRTTANVHYCEMCPDITFRTLSILKQHMKQHIENRFRKKCAICNKRPFDMEKHIELKHTVERPFKCDYYESAFKTDSYRIIHMRIHTRERPFLCSTCGKSFSSQATRKKHEIRLHSEKMPHACQQCDRTFLNPSHLQEHIYALHTKEKHYVCDICGKTFATKKYLRKHKLIHGERKNPCKYCEKKFKTSESRRGHERNVHKIF